MDSKAKGTIRSNSKKAITDNAMRKAPLVLVRAYVINSDATAIKPNATKDAHILSKDDISLSPIGGT
jgi:hypothetical protein